MLMILQLLVFYQIIILIGIIDHDDLIIIIFLD